MKIFRTLIILFAVTAVSAGLWVWKTIPMGDNPLYWKIKKAIWLAQAKLAPKTPWLDMDYGPFISASISIGQPDEPIVDVKPGENIAYKGIAIALTPKKDASILFDTEMVRYAGGWLGDNLVLTDTVYDGAFDTHPYVKGAKVFETNVQPGWAHEGSFKDPRTEEFGHLPDEWAKYRGLYVHGDKTVISYTVNGTGVLDLPALVEAEGINAITRTLEIEPTSKELILDVERVAVATTSTLSLKDLKPMTGSAKDTLVTFGGMEPYVAAVSNAPEGASWDLSDKANVRLRIPASSSVQRFTIYLAQIRMAEMEEFAGLIKKAPAAESLTAYTKGGPARYTQTVETSGTLGPEPGPYAVDELTLPVDNPWRSWMRPGDIAFFSDDRAAMTTWSGDVWIVSGLNDSLSKLTWRRYATGLAQPLGLEIVDNVVYVLGRDQITRLNDLNNDGEADYYENFNNDFLLTHHYHEFTFDLDRDREGNFYFAKGARHGLPANTKHHGTILRLDKNGKNLHIVCTGVRVPNGVALGPNGEITTSDQEGHWMPATRLDMCTEGSFHGNMWGGSIPPGRTTYDKPIVWLPKSFDNSGAGQAYVDNNRWGPFQGMLVHSSFGRSEISLVMMEKVEGQIQAGAVRFPLEFATGLMRPEFRPKDGQLYLCGLFGWGTRQRKMGGFYRVRYTGKPVYMPEEFHATKDGVYIGFTTPLDPSSAENTSNYAVSRWNYEWAAHYGSPEFKKNGQKGHDKLTVKAAKLQDDKRTVFLQIEDMSEVMQMQTKYDIKAADGTRMKSEILHSVNVLSAKKGERVLAQYPAGVPTTSIR